MNSRQDNCNESLLDSLRSASLHDRLLGVVNVLAEVEHFTRTVSLILAGLAAKCDDEQNTKDLIISAHSVDQVTNWLAVQSSLLTNTAKQNNVPTPAISKAVH